MPISKLGQRRQVVIPKAICDALGIAIGDFMEVRATRGKVVITPKKLVDADDVLTPEEETIVRRGVRQLKQGASKSWQQIKHEMDL